MQKSFVVCLNNAKTIIVEESPSESTSIITNPKKKKKNSFGRVLVLSSKERERDITVKEIPKNKNKNKWKIATILYERLRRKLMRENHALAWLEERMILLKSLLSFYLLSMASSFQNAITPWW